MDTKEKMLELIKKKQGGGRSKKWPSLKMIDGICEKDQKFIINN
ncbi:hypothetical protein ACQ63C_000413 [Enterococcus hirae]